MRRTVARVSPRGAPDGVRVLLYHAIDDPDPTDRLSLRVRRDSFLAQMDWLRDHGYAVVPLWEVCHGRPGGERRVALTFDDGYRSVAWASEVLRGFGYPATVFVVPRFLDGVTDPAVYWERWGHLAWDEMGTLVENGCDIGAHSATHRDLRTCSDEELTAEVAGARAGLEDRLGREVTTFSYPYGRYDRRVRQAVAEAGYTLGCTSRYGANRSGGPCYDVRRIEVAGTDTLDDFEWKLRGKYDWVGYWQDMTPNR